MQTLNTDLWNLGSTSLAVAAIGLTTAACGPAVGLEGDTDGMDVETESDTIIDPSDPSEGSDTDPAECTLPQDCGPGFDCIAGECIEDDDYDCDDGGDCYCYYGHCSPPYYYECYSDDECGDGDLCQGNYCEPVQNLPPCDGPATAQGVPIPIPTQDPVVSLAFVDLDEETPGEALIVGTALEGFVLQADQETVVLPPLPSGVRDAAASDLDADGAVDLALLHDQGLTILYGFGTETQTQLDAVSVDPPTAIEVFQPAESNVGLVLRTTANEAYVVDGLQERAPLLRLLDAPVSVSGLASFDDGAGSAGFLLNGFANELALRFFAEDAYEELGSYPRNNTVRRLVSGALGGDASDDALFATAFGGWTYLELILDADQHETRALYLDYPLIATGDLDGNGLDDTFLLGEGGFAVLPGDDEWGMTCFAQGPLLSSTSVLEIGDFNGDGIESPVAIDETGELLAYDVSWEQ